MIEDLIIEYLNKNLLIPVVGVIEPNLPEEFVLVEKTGGGWDNHVQRATISIRSYAGTTRNAAVLNEDIKKLMLGDGDGYESGITSVENISKCGLNSDYNATDTVNKRPRYQAVYDLVYM